jgi:hypothetical protein
MKLSWRPQRKIIQMIRIFAIQQDGPFEVPRGFAKRVLGGFDRRLLTRRFAFMKRVTLDTW